MDQPIVINQTAPQNTSFPVDKVLKSYPQFIKCPLCGAVAPTMANRSCNIGNVCCFIFLPGWWWLCGMCKEKDMNCYDAQHICMSCQRPVYQYSAC